MGSVRLSAGGIAVDLIDDCRIARHVAEEGSFEPKTLALWVQLCQSGSLVIDAGAYSGLFSILASKRGARAIAIEPQPELAARMAENAALNGVSFEVLAAAASDHDGEARLGVNAAVHLTSGASLLRKSGHGIAVRTLRLDSLDLTRVTAIKIDVERAELMVLAGAAALIKRDRPALIVEALDDAARAAVRALLKNYREIAYLDRRNMVLLPD